VQLTNETPFEGRILVSPDRDGAETMVTVLKGTFRIDGDHCVPAEEQAELVGADKYFGKPGESSLRYETDLSPIKPATDVILIGHAYAPKPGAKEGRVALKVGPVAQEARIFGNRRFGVTLGIPRIEGPIAFDKIPLVYERAFGGAQPDKGGEGWEGAEERNPVGTGFVKKRRNSFVDGLALPNIEHPKKSLKAPGGKVPPVGFGFVGRHWLPRRELMGTYDAKWKRDRMPLLPKDFDDRAFCGAPEALQASPHLKGGEPVAAHGVTADGQPLRFRLPEERFTMEAYYRDRWEPLEYVLDTVIIEPDDLRVMLTWRTRLNVHRHVHALKMVRIRRTS
jgi:hypothetical protein